MVNRGTRRVCRQHEISVDVTEKNSEKAVVGRDAGSLGLPLESQRPFKIFKTEESPSLF